MSYTIEEILDQYKDAAIQYGKASAEDDANETNKFHDIIINCYLKLKSMFKLL